MENNNVTPTPQPSQPAPMNVAPQQVNTAPQPAYQPQQPTYAPAPAPVQSQGSVLALVLSLAALTAVIIFFILRTQGTGGGYDPELNSLRSQVEQKRIASGLNGTSDTSTGLAAENLAEQISLDSGNLSGLIRDVTDRLAAKDGIITQKNNELTNAANARQSLLDDIAGKDKTIEELRRNSAGSSSLKLQLEDTRTLLDTANRELARLRERLAGSPTDETMRRLKDELARSEAELAKLKESLNNLPDNNTVSDLQQENRRLRLELQSLRAESSRNRLFAENADMLSPQALTLFNQLTSLEGSSNDARLQAYETIKDQLDARVVETVSFSTGSSSIDVEKVNVMIDSLKKTSATAEYLIVGYASKSGSLSTNRELSSKRATTVATVADLERGKNQTVKAVFLGQTDRFSKANDYSNQICEVWEIKAR